MVEVENSICRIEDYNDYKYWYGRKAFTRVRKWSFMDYVLFVLVNKGRSSAIEIEEYVKERWDDESKIISKQALSKQRLKIKPKIFKDMNIDFIKDVFNSSEFEHDFKDYTILLVDGSDLQLPNIKITKEEFNVAPDTIVYTQAPSVKASMLIDAKYNLVVDAILGDFKSNERELVKQHISNIEDKINLEKTIIIFDRGYISLELMLFLENKGIKYLFRSNERYYQNEILTMKSRDETVQLEINTNRTQNIKDKNIKKQALNLEYYQTRISKPLLDNGVTEILFTNITESEADIHKLKELYKMRWEIELNYEKIKNKIRIENFSGKRRTIIEQDFYSQIYIFNLQMAIQNKAQKELEPENKELREKHDKEKRPNTNLGIGRLKNKLTQILLKPLNEIKRILNNLIIKSIKFTTDHKFNRSSTNRKIKRHVKYAYNLRRSF